MKTAAIHVKSEAIGGALGAIASIQPQVVFMFAAPEVLRKDGALKEIHGALSGATLIGCSTAGEIGMSGVTDGQVALAGLHLEKTETRFASA
ncbi:MAG: hypothetical protein KC496_22930, partial [Anaerolineae bacterium]|nr:hypothetical protein [Anaerolineae bacterium]